MRPAGRCPRDPEFPVLRRSNAHVAFWNEGPKIPTNQPEARELPKADGLPAIKRSSFFSCREIPSLPEQPTAAATPPPVSALWFSSHKAQSRILLYEGCHDFPS